MVEHLNLKLKRGKKSEKELFFVNITLFYNFVNVFILTVYTEHVVSRCVSQLQLYDTGLHHDVISGVEVTYFN